MDFLLQYFRYGFLLSPRDYLSSIMKISVIGLLAVGIIIVAPEIKMPAFTEFIQGGGPIIPGKLFPTCLLQLHVVQFPVFIHL